METIHDQKLLDSYVRAHGRGKTADTIDNASDKNDKEREP